METVVYYYHRPQTTAPSISSPATWQAVGVFPAADWAAFQRDEFIDRLPTGAWPERLTHADVTLPVTTLSAERGWVDLQHVFFERHHTATPLTILDHAAYLRTTIHSETNRDAVLRLAIDDWAIVWLNGQRIGSVRHPDELKVARFPLPLKQGENELRIKTNNTDEPGNKRLWAIHCAVE